MMTTSCSTPAKKAPGMAHDIHSYGNPEEARVRHLNLDLDVLFDRLTIQGTAVLTIERISPQAKRLVVDTRAMQIDETEISPDGVRYREARFDIGKADPILGAPLTIDIAPDTQFVRIRYSTSPSNATALQWLTPEQTEGKEHPFLYTQSQAIHARSWIPLQDSPGVRVTWEARVKVPPGLKAVMSAVNCPDAADCKFVMDHPVPPYLIALAVGDLHFQSTGPRSGVWAEPSMVGKAASEFSDMERMLEATEKLYGPYRWTRYDVLVLPPSFPFGGMENPCLTFATPTVLAGDKSLVSLVAHELAHSWSGNLVTNATWSDFWLNEGFTVYIERRILEELYGRSRAEMEAALGYRGLQDELKSHPSKDRILHVDLKGRDPDDGATRIPYEKGALFLTQLEQVFGRPKFDAYLKDYFDHFAFQSITTAESLDYMRRHLFTGDPQAPLDPQVAGAAATIPVNEWVYRPGLPASVPVPQPEAFAAVDRKIADWMHGKPIETATWTTQEWQHFLLGLPEHLDAAQMKRLDKAFHLTDSGNGEILSQWLLMAVRNHYAPANQRLEAFLTTVGRRKYVRPLYAAMDPKQANAIYDRARPMYHPITQATIDALLAAKNGGQ
ncbi:MAG: M1 family metallopeptidase [Bryobacteraceae bacterium]